MITILKKINWFIALIIKKKKKKVGLYAEYDKRNLLPFLKQSNSCPLEEAYKICSERDLLPEMVYVLGRMGNNREALNLILDRMGDVDQVSFFFFWKNTNCTKKKKKKKKKKGHRICKRAKWWWSLGRPY